MAIPRLPTNVEMHVVALIARGDRYQDIQVSVKEEFGKNVSAGAITAIKKRNEVALKTISEAIAQKEKDDAEGLLTRSHRLIGKKLRAAENEDADIKLSDLTAVSREMFHQTHANQAPPVDPLALSNPKEKLKELQALLEENDEIRLERIIFAKREPDSELHSQPNGDQQEKFGSQDGSILQGGNIYSGDNTNPSQA